jgi:hypothetical protein
MFQTKFIWIIFKNSDRTAKKTQHFTIKKVNWLTLFKESNCYKASSDRIINEFERIWKKTVGAWSEVLSWHLSRESVENTRNVCRASRCPGRRLNLGPPTYEAGVPTSRPGRCSRSVRHKAANGAFETYWVTFLFWKSVRYKRYCSFAGFGIWYVSVERLCLSVLWSGSLSA